MNIPTIGVAKKIHVFGDMQKSSLEAAAKSMPILGKRYIYENGEKLGAMMNTSKKHRANPVFVSQGHQISLQMAITIVRLCMLSNNPFRRLPEPIYAADFFSRLTTAEIDLAKRNSWKNFVSNNKEMSLEEKGYWKSYSWPKIERKLFQWWKNQRAKICNYGN